MAPALATYEPRDPSRTVLYHVIADHLDLLLQSPEFVVPFGVEAADAVRRYREGSADFADYLLAAINRASGCRSTLTFDREAADDDQFTLLKV